MERRKRNRLLSIFTLMTLVSLGVYIILTNLKDNIVFFYPPSEISKIRAKATKVRVGGMVKEGSIQQISDGKISFVITDYNAEIKIEYEGILPALFRENQGIVAEGSLDKDDIFFAKTLLAKHDENYMPPNIDENIKANHKKSSTQGKTD